MSAETKCPKCSSEYAYSDGNLWICPECSHEWNPLAEASKVVIAEDLIRDAYGNILQEGDNVTVVKDLKVKGSSSVVKVGTKVRGIHLTDAGDGHNISCRIDGFGEMNLKSEFVKKAL